MLSYLLDLTLWLKSKILKEFKCAICVGFIVILADSKTSRVFTSLFSKRSLSCIFLVRCCCFFCSILALGSDMMILVLLIASLLLKLLVKYLFYLFLHCTTIWWLPFFVQEFIGNFLNQCVVINSSYPYWISFDSHCLICSSNRSHYFVFGNVVNFLSGLNKLITVSSGFGMRMMIMIMIFGRRRKVEKTWYTTTFWGSVNVFFIIFTE